MPSPHGTRTRYGYWGCRCDLCRQANANAARRGREERSSRLEDAPHGTVTGYLNWACRCDDCRMAHTGAAS